MKHQSNEKIEKFNHRKTIKITHKYIYQTMENISMLHYTNKFYQTITSLYSKEEILNIEQSDITPVHTTENFFIPYFAFNIVKNDVNDRIEKIHIVLDYINTHNMDFNTNDDITYQTVLIERECTEIEQKMQSATSKINEFWYNTFMMSETECCANNDFIDNNNPNVVNKPKQIYTGFFEMKNKALEYLQMVSNIEHKVNEFQFKIHGFQS